MKNTINFSAKDYLNMMKKRGIRLPITYFFENHYFDIKRKIDTHTWLPIEKFDENIKNIENGTLYMCSWTSIIKKATLKMKKLSHFDFNNSDFIDIGCGKGKVLIVWDEILKEKIRIFGIDYSEQLVSTCLKNLRNIELRHEIKVIKNDITEVDFSEFKDNIVIYMYNPFNKIILQILLSKIKDKNICIIYNNPIYNGILISDGFKLAYEQKGWHPNYNFSLFTKSKGITRLSNKSLF